LLLGMAAGIVGCFTLLRRRALTGDALSHATLPGVGLAFLTAPAFGLEQKSLPVLLCGAALSGAAGVAAILFIRNLPRLKEDAAIGIVLSVFFGAGIALLSVVQQLPNGHSAGLESFIYGKTASMTAGDAWLIGIAGVIAAGIPLLLFRPFQLLCFDEAYAASRGYPVFALDFLLMSVVVLVTIIGLQAVGLVLMIALLVIPAASARFWTNRLHRMLIIAGVSGSVSGLAGSAISALFPDLPSGAVIVLVCSALFFFSMTFGQSQGVLIRVLRRRSLRMAMDREHLLRGIFELCELQADTTFLPERKLAVSLQSLLDLRTWTPAQLKRQIRKSAAEGMVWQNSDGAIELTGKGRSEAARLVHHHRLWELYLISHADVAASRVDQEADAIEHVLEPELIEQLEELLKKEHRGREIPASPHPIESAQRSGLATPLDLPEPDSTASHGGK
jgi:manganese/zinc/iron transport system permease protein